MSIATLSPDPWAAVSSPPPGFLQQPHDLPALVISRRWLSLALGLIAGVWATLVLGAAYPRLIQHLLGASDGQAFGAVRLPDQVSAEPLLSGLWCISGVLLLAAVAYPLGWRLLALARLSRTEHPAPPLTTLAIGLAGISHLVLAVAAVGQLRAPVLLGVGGLLVGHALHWRLHHSFTLRSEPSQAGASLGTGRLALGLGLALLGVFVGIGIIGTLQPEVEFDALWYHLANPQLALQAGHLVDLPSEFTTLYPQSTELLFALGLLWQGTAGAKMVHLLFGVLTGLATYRLARRWLAPSFAVAAAAICLGAPTASWELTTAHVDLAVAFFVTTAITELLAWWDTRRKAALLRSGLLLGCALASKDVAFVCLAPAVCLLAVDSWRSLAGGPRRLLRALQAPALFGALALAVPAPWYLRSWLATGDPVFPVFAGLLGAPADRWNALTEQGLRSVGDQFGMGRGLGVLLTLPWQLVAHPDQFAGTFGPLLLLAIPCAVLLPHAARRGLGRLSLLGLGYLALWASPVWSLEVRYLLPILPSLAVLAAAGLAGLAHQLSMGGYRRAASGLLPTALLLLVLQLPMFIPLTGSGPWITSTLHELNVAAAVDPTAAEAYTAAHVRGYGAIRFANQNLPAEARVLTFVEGANYYFRPQVLLSYAPVAQPATWLTPPGQDAQVLATLHDLSVTHVLIDRQRQDLQRFPLTISDPRFLSSQLVLLYEDSEAALYAVPPAAAPGSA